MLKRQKLKSLAESIRTGLRMCGQVASPIPRIFSILPPGAIMKLPASNNFWLAIALKTAKVIKSYPSQMVT